MLCPLLDESYASSLLFFLPKYADAVLSPPATSVTSLPFPPLSQGVQGWLNI